VRQELSTKICDVDTEVDLKGLSSSTDQSEISTQMDQKLPSLTTQIHSGKFALLVIDCHENDSRKRNCAVHNRLH
jgi:hypothetical protein